MMTTWTIHKNRAFQAVVLLILMYSAPGAALQNSVAASLSGDLRNEGATRYNFGVTAERGTLHDDARSKTGSLFNESNDPGNDDVNGFPPICIEDDGGDVELIRLNVVSTRFHCTESMCEHHYDNCIVEIDYELVAETRADLTFETSVSCTADITYGTGHGYILKSSTDATPDLHDLEPHALHTYHTTMCFAFSRYEEVITAQLDSVQCRIRSVEPK